MLCEKIEEFDDPPPICRCATCILRNIDSNDPTQPLISRLPLQPKKPTQSDGGTHKNKHTLIILVVNDNRSQQCNEEYPCDISQSDSEESSCYCCKSGGMGQPCKTVSSYENDSMRTRGSESSEIDFCREKKGKRYHPLLIRRPVCKDMSASKCKDYYTEEDESDEENSAGCTCWCDMQRLEETFKKIVANDDCMCYCQNMSKKGDLDANKRKLSSLDIWQRKQGRLERKRQIELFKRKSKYNRFYIPQEVLEPKPWWLNCPSRRFCYHGYGPDPKSCYKQDFQPVSYIWE